MTGIKKRRFFNPQRTTRLQKIRETKGKKREKALQEFQAFEAARKGLHQGMVGWFLFWRKPKKRLLQLFFAVSGRPALAQQIIESLQCTRYQGKLTFFGKKLNKQQVYEVIKWLAVHGEPNPTPEQLQFVREQLVWQLTTTGLIESSELKWLKKEKPKNAMKEMRERAAIARKTAKKELKEE
jgi:hypothetical protein